ncbi:MAG: hypothetical protein AB1489_13310 [Acidobacteriota bacterium]
MAKLQVKTESLPARCEICHQSDLFDASNNRCQRCSPNNLTQYVATTFQSRADIGTGSWRVPLFISSAVVLAIVVLIIGLRQQGDPQDSLWGVTLLLTIYPIIIIGLAIGCVFLLLKKIWKAALPLSQQSQMERYLIWKASQAKEKKPQKRSSSKSY